MSTGGSHQNQNQAYTGNTSSNSNGTNSAISTNTPNVPGQVQNYYNQAGGNVGADGYTDAQRQAVGIMNGQQGQGTTAVQSSINALNGLAPQYQNLASQSYTPWQSAQAATPDNVTAQSGAQNMGNYQSPYLNDVVNSALKGYDNQSAQTLNQMHAARDAGSAFGDRAGVADAVYQGQSDLGRGQLASNLLNTGFNTAAGYGQQDASRNLGAAQGNQQIGAQTNQFNAGLQNQASQYNAQNQLQHQNSILNALQGFGSNAINTSNLAQSGVGLNQGLAGGLFNTGTTGQGQLINLVGAGSPFIGNTNTLNGSTTNQTTGTGSGTSSGSGSGKSSGISI